METQNTQISPSGTAKPVTNFTISDQLRSLNDSANLHNNSVVNIDGIFESTQHSVNSSDSSYQQLKCENVSCSEGNFDRKDMLAVKNENNTPLSLGAAVERSIKRGTKYELKSFIPSDEAPSSVEVPVNNSSRLERPIVLPLNDDTNNKEKSSPSKEFKRPSLNIALAENALKLLPENREVDFSSDSAYEEDWHSDNMNCGRRMGSVSGESSYSRRTSSNAGDSDCLVDPGESISRRASSGVSSTDGRSAYSRAQSIDDEPGESVSRRASSNTCDAGDSIEDSSGSRGDRTNRRLENVFGSKESLNRRTSGGNQSDTLDIHDPLSRRDSLLEAVLAAKRGGWRNLTRSESVESSASSFASSLNSSLASDTSGCPCDDCLLGLTQPPRPKKTSNWRKVKNVVQWTPFIQTYKRHKYPWVQLAGHQGNFKAGEKQGTILKKLCPAEQRALEGLMKDVLKPFVPEYMGLVESGDQEQYLQLQDLLSDFTAPCVMDIKMGVRTYLEDELAKAREKPKLRKDMYEKMIQIDPAAPSEAEQRAQAVTKPRYMVWRETISSTATQGFRIEGVKKSDGTSSKDFKTTRTQEHVLGALESFVNGYGHAPGLYLKRLQQIRATLESSKFFMSHELIGSSLLFVHNEDSAVVWLIDFAKSIPLPSGVAISHRAPWVEGSHEDGYLLGLDNLILLMTQLEQQQQQLQQQKVSSSTSTTSTAAEKQNKLPADTTENSTGKVVGNDIEARRITTPSTNDSSSISPPKQNSSLNDNSPINSNNTDTKDSPNIPLSRNDYNEDRTKELSRSDSNNPIRKDIAVSPSTDLPSPTDIRNLITNSNEANSIS